MSPSGGRDSRLWSTALRSLAALALLVSVTLVVGTGASLAAPKHKSAALCQQLARLTRLVVTRSDRLPQNNTTFSFPARVTVSNPPQGRSVALALCALPYMPKGAIACPADLGIVYQLAFLGPKQAYPPVTVDASGCQGVHGLGPTRWVERSPGFWNSLGSAMGLARPAYAALRGSLPQG